VTPGRAGYVRGRWKCLSSRVPPEPDRSDSLSDHITYTAGKTRSGRSQTHSIRAAGLGPPVEQALVSLLALNGLRVSEATGADIEHLGLERGHRTLTITRKGGKVVTFRWRPAPPGDGYARIVVLGAVTGFVRFTVATRGAAPPVLPGEDAGISRGWRPGRQAVRE